MKSNYSDSNQEKSYDLLLKQLSRYIQKDVFNAVKENLSNGGKIPAQKTEVTIMFADLRGSTDLSENVDTDLFFKLINIWLLEMGALIERHNGTIIDYLGDEVFSVFGAPVENARSRQDAVQCALDMQEEIQELNKLLTDLGYPNLHMGIGIHYGSVIVGTIGAKELSKYGVVGRNVNFTARIQAQAQAGQVLVSEEVRDVLADEIKTGEVKEFAAKGIIEPVKVYEVLEYINR